MKKLQPTKEENKVMAKVLVEEGYSSRKIEEVLGIDHSTINRYAVEETPEEQRQFATFFKNYISTQKSKGVSLVHQRILELIPKERRLDQLVKTGEYLEGKNNPQGPTVAVQVNNVINDKKNEYGI